MIQAEQPMERPIIALVGTSRSGKTVVSDILSRSPEVFCFRELHFFDSNKNSTTETPCAHDAAVQLYAKLLDIQNHGILGQGHASDYTEEAQKQVEHETLTGKPAFVIYNNFLRHFVKRKKPGARPCTQTGGDIYYIEDMRKLFPGIQIICLLRDPRFVLASKKKKWGWQQVRQVGAPTREWMRQRLHYHPWILSKLWRTTARKALEFKDCSNAYILKFESLTQKTQKQIKELCDFLQIENQPEMHTVFNHEIDELNAIPLQAPKTHCETHRRCALMGISPAELFICQLACASEMQILGYEHWKVWPNPLSLLWHLLILPVKLVLAVIVNYSRFDRLRDAVKRRLAA